MTEGLSAGRPGESLQLRPGAAGLEGGEAAGGGGGRDQPGGEAVGRAVAGVRSIVSTRGGRTHNFSPVSPVSRLAEIISVLLSPE